MFGFSFFIINLFIYLFVFFFHAVFFRSFVYFIVYTAIKSSSTEHHCISGKMFPSALLLTASHLYNVRRIPEREGMGFIRYRFALSAIARITGEHKKNFLGGS